MSTPPAAIAAFDDYDFGADTVFQAGLASILAGISDASEKAAAAAKAKRFYYSRIKGTAPSVTTASASPPLAAPQQQHPQEPEADSDALRYPPSFAEIVQMVAEGKPIPGVREIPDTVADAPPTQAALKPRLKPWEVPAAPDSSPSPAAASSAHF